MKIQTTKIIPRGALFAVLLLAVTGAFAQSPAEQAAELLKKNDLAATEALLTPLTSADGKDAAAFFQLGLLRLRQQRAADAVAALEKATMLDATKPEYFSQLGVAISVKMQGRTSWCRPRPRRR